MTNTTKGLFITSIGIFIMSFESLLIKLTSIDPIKFSFYIGLCMFLSMSMLLISKKINVLKEIKHPKFKIALLGAILMAFANLFFIAAIKNTLAANVVLIISTTPLFSALIGFLFYRVKPTKNVYIASFFIFVGLFIIFGARIASGDLLGNIYAIVCTIFFSTVYVILSKHTNFDRTLLLTMAGFVLAFLTFLLLDNIEVDKESLIFVLLMGLIVTPISRLFITNGTKFIQATEVSLLMIIETIMAPLWVWIFLQEIPNKSTFYGGFIILSTIIINSLYLMKTNKN